MPLTIRAPLGKDPSESLKGSHDNPKGGEINIMKKSILFAMAILGVALLFASTAIYAGTKVPDVVKMEKDAYKEHTKGIVEFTHKKHAEDYAKKHPDLYKDGCGACHHDKDGKPLKNLKAGDDVKDCIACHKKPGEMPRDEKKALRAKKASREEVKKAELEYHAEAIHENCKGCHREFKKKTKSRAAPTTCSQCHPTEKK